MFTKEDYEASHNEIKQIKTLVDNDPYRLGFHMMPTTGWLNDPNGLCQFKGKNHIYFQYTPDTPTWGTKLWGHYCTTDWITYQEEEPFLFPDTEYDTDGVYSGSAFVKEDEIHYFYTGNVKYEGEYNYIQDGREQNTIEIISKDGYTYQQKHLIFTNKDYPNDLSCHVRDPKVFEKDGAYYMVIGARSVEDKGCVILYTSKNLKQWDYHMRIQSYEPFGYMWECPDIVEIQGKTFLICCPQGVKQQENRYQNIYQFGYFEVALNLEEKTYSLSPFVELDKGFDIYAPQTFLDEKGRRILIAWMGIPDADYDNQETVKNGWQHALTLPRELIVEEGRLCQKPLQEFQALRKQTKKAYVENTYEQATTAMYELEIQFTNCESFCLNLRNGVTLWYSDCMLCLQFDACGSGRDNRKVELSSLQSLQIFMDTSSLELFINGGQEVMTSRYYTTAYTPVTMKGVYQASITMYECSSFIIKKQERI